MHKKFLFHFEDFYVWKLSDINKLDFYKELTLETKFLDAK